MAEVYLAVAEGLSGFEKQVVIKRLLPQHARSGELLSMFLDEARLVATLRHPNIAEVYDVGAQEGDYFFAMEHVAGRDLRDILESHGGEPLPLPEALAIVIAVADGLHCAHEQRDQAGRLLQIVHRDVSPSNVLVSAAGDVKLIDFGVAKWAAQKSETRHGVLKGKCAYMSPEQCRAEPLDRRSDVFSLGVLLYEITTGHRPFEADNDFETMTAIVRGTVQPPSARRPDYPPILEEIVLRALAPKPGDRQATAKILGQQLAALAKQQGLTSSAAALEALLQRLFGHEAFGRAGGMEGEAATREALPTLMHPSGSIHPSVIERTATDHAAMAVAGTLAGPRVRRKRVFVGVGALLVAGIVGVSVAVWRRPASAPVVTAPAAPVAPATAPPRTATAVHPWQPDSTSSGQPSAASRPTRPPLPRKRSKAAPAPKTAVQLWDPESAKPPP
jgi:tRNA A-37 threonylcarbamoyl transferase component Bud32